MTDNEIIWCLEWLIADYEADKPTGIKEKYYRMADCATMRRALDLINRQKAEIERLKSPCEMQIEVSKKLEATIKAEAVKEFAERLKYRTCCIPQHHFTYAEVEQHIDYLVKEMAGETA